MKRLMTGTIITVGLIFSSFSLLVDSQQVAHAEKELYSPNTPLYNDLPDQH